MKLDVLAFCSWFLTYKFKMSAIFDPMIYEIRFFFSFSLPKSSYQQSMKRTLPTLPKNFDEQVSNIWNSVHCFLRQVHKSHEILELDWSYSFWKKDHSQQESAQSMVWGAPVGWVVIWHEASWIYSVFLLIFIRRTITACLNFVSWMFFLFALLLLPHVTYSWNIYLDHVTYRLYSWIEGIHSIIEVRKNPFQRNWQ